MSGGEPCGPPPEQRASSSGLLRLGDRIWRRRLSQLKRGLTHLGEDVVERIEDLHVDASGDRPLAPKLDHSIGHAAVQLHEGALVGLDEPRLAGHTVALGVDPRELALRRRRLDVDACVFVLVEADVAVDVVIAVLPRVHVVLVALGADEHPAGPDVPDDRRHHRRSLAGEDDPPVRIERQREVRVLGCRLDHPEWRATFSLRTLPESSGEGSTATRPGWAVAPALCAGVALVELQQQGAIRINSSLGHGHGVMRPSSDDLIDWDKL